MVAYQRFFFVGFMAFLVSQLSPTRALLPDCPLDLSMSNFTPVSSACSVSSGKGKCCRYINSFVAISVARYANTTGNLGVLPNVSETCVRNISSTIERYGVPPTAKSFCGLGTKIPVNFGCMGRTNIDQMLEYLKVTNVFGNCSGPLSEETNCKRCIDASISHLRNITGPDNVTLNICRDATFVTLTSQGNELFAVANCFFGVQLLVAPPVSLPPVPLFIPATNPVSQPLPPPPFAPKGSRIDPSGNIRNRPFHLTLIPTVGIAITAVALMMLVVLVYFIHRERKELEDPKPSNCKGTLIKIHEGQPVLRRFSYRETKRATGNFKTIIGEGGFGTVYKAQFSDGFVAAVKRMNKISEQCEDEFCREIQLLARLHHRHLVSLRGFCIEKHERFLIYEYMQNGSLKDNLHSPDRNALSWQTRIQIAINVANALEYLHFYCDPPLCHRDIKSSNILLDEKFVAKVADFGLAHASRIGSVFFEPVNTDIQGTPGYMDPEYVITQELTEKSDVYSYGVLLLEMVTARHAIQGKENLVGWSQKFMASESRLSDLVDSRIRGSFDLNQLQTIVTIVKWCTQRERWGRPSIQEVIGLLHECSDTRCLGPVKGAADEGKDDEGEWKKRRDGKMHRNEENFQSWDGRGLPYSSSTSRSCCSRNLLFENGSPQSPF